MEIDVYQQQATKTADYPEIGNNLIYPALGLAGEAGEVVERVKKAWRNYGAVNIKSLSFEDKLKIIRELGDVLWYVAAMCDELQIDMSHIAEVNLAKLTDRVSRGVIKSEGDNR